MLKSVNGLKMVSLCRIISRTIRSIMPAQQRHPLGMLRDHLALQPLDAWILMLTNSNHLAAQWSCLQRAIDPVKSATLAHGMVGSILALLADRLRDWHKTASKKLKWSNIPNSVWRRSGVLRLKIFPPLSLWTTRAMISSRNSISNNKRRRKPPHYF